MTKFETIAEIVEKLNSLNAESGDLLRMEFRRQVDMRFKAETIGNRTAKKLGLLEASMERTWCVRIAVLVDETEVVVNPRRMLEEPDYAPALAAAMIIRQSGKASIVGGMES
jgi:hypothetical protein